VRARKPGISARRRGPCAATRREPHIKRSPTVGYLASFAGLLRPLSIALTVSLRHDNVERAYPTMKQIQLSVPLGQFTRNMRRWSAHAMVLVVFLHMARASERPGDAQGLRRHLVGNADLGDGPLPCSNR